jgi:sugar/nucleoside kinase (ribokinase family)
VAVVSTAEDRHTFLSYPGDDLPVQPLYVRWRRTLANVDALYVDGFSMLQEHIMGAAFQASEKVHERGGKTFFDPGPSLVGISRNLLCNYSGIFLTEDELRKWAGSADTVAARSLIAQGPELVVIKQGANGCLVVTAGESYPCPGISVPMRDTMGAGDVFNAAFVVAMMTGQSLPECGAIANAAGAATVQKFGAGRNVPTLEEVKALRNSR